MMQGRYSEEAFLQKMSEEVPNYIRREDMALDSYTQQFLEAIYEPLFFEMDTN